MSCHAQQSQVLLLPLSSGRIIQIVKQASIREWIVEPYFLVRELHRHQLGLAECDCQVLTVPILRDPVRMCALRDHNRTPLHPPRQDRLRNRSVLDLGQGDPRRIVQDAGESGVVHGVQVGEGRVRDDLDAVADVPGDEIGLLEVGVGFEFVGGGADLGGLQELFDLVLGKV